jgi:uncharacterized protein YdaU (DUF1376 family)
VTQPFLPLFFGDFLASTAEWSGEERALYLLALSYQWSMGSLPVDPKRLAKLVDYERRSFDASWDTVSKKFVERDGRLYNLRLEQHRQKSLEVSNKRAIAGANGAAKRWQKESNSHEGANGNGIAIATTLSSHPSHPIQELNPKSQKPASPAQVSDPKKAIFDLGVSLLGESKRALIGKAVSQVGIPKVSEVLGYLASHEVADRETYFAKATQPKAREVVC